MGTRAAPTELESRRAVGLPVSLAARLGASPLPSPDLSSTYNMSGLLQLGGKRSSCSLPGALKGMEGLGCRPGRGGGRP